MRQYLFPIWEELGVARPTPEQVRRYLLTRNWCERPFGPELFVFEGPNDDADQPITLVLPCSAEMPAYPQRLLDLLGALCRIEQRLIRDILADMLAPESSVALEATTVNAASANGAQAKAIRPKRSKT